VLYRAHARDRQGGRPRKIPRLKVRNTPACEVREIFKHSPILRKIPWERFHVKDGSKGPMVWEAKRIPFWIKDENGLPSRPHHLMMARNVLKPGEVKYFLSNAPEATSVEVLLLVAFSRWHIERLFEDSKTELGLDHFEVRKFPSIVRHLILTSISHLFLAEFWLAERKKKSGVDRLPGADRHPSPGPDVDTRRPMLATAGRIDRRAIVHNRGAKRRRSKIPPKANSSAPARDWSSLRKHTHLQVAKVLAL
jgi:hypothetical protein